MEGDSPLGGQLLDAFLANTEEYAYVKDGAGRLRMVSHALARALGFEDRSRLIGLRPEELAADTTAERIFPGREVEVRDERGELTAVVGVSRDATDRRLAAIIATQRDAASADLDLESVMGTMCTRAMELTGADGASVALLKDGRLRFGASRGTPENDVGEELGLDTSFAGRAIREGRALITHDTAEDSRVDPVRARRSGVRSIVAVPLQHGGSPVGTLLVLSRSPHAFDAEDMHTLELVSVAISASMSHAAEFEALSRFRTIFEGASVGIVRVGADGRALEINAAVRRMLGYTSRDHTENSFELFTHPDDLEETRRFMRELMAGERERYEQDKRYIRKDGEQIWVHVRGWLEPPVEGEARTAIAMIENINERKLAEIALRENADRLERLVATQRDIAAAGVDLEGVMRLIVDRSQALTRAEGAIVSIIEGDELVVGAACGIASHLVGTRRAVEESVVSHALRDRGALLIEDAESDPRLYSSYAEDVQDVSHICVPLFQGERPVGALNVMTASDGPRLDEDDRRTLELLAVVLASALSRAAEFEAKRRQVEVLARFEATYSSALAGIMTLDMEGRIVDANPALQGLMGYTELEFAGTRAIDYVDPEHRDALLSTFARGRSGEEGSSTLEHRVTCKSGELLWVNSSVSFIRGASGEPTLAILMVQDVTQRKAAERALMRQSELNEHQARHDSLTGLANRTLFSDRIAHAIEAARPASSSVTVMVIDLDRFKEVNDSLGHHAGDELLQEVARRLAGVLRTSDAVARLGGDEFGILLPEPGTYPSVRAVIDRLTGALEEPITVQGLPLVVEASIGVAVFPDDGVDVETLLRAADVAMYTAKEEQTGFAFFDGSTHQLDLARLTLVGELRRALEKGELVLHYQPQARLQGGEVASVEALLRWQHPERGLIGPDEFIPLAQQTGLIRPLTLHVIGEALRQVRVWQEEGLELAVAVNVSTRNLLDMDFPTQVKALLDAWELPASHLQLEITEDSVLTDPVRTKAILEELAEMGLQLAIDDFGTGYSSLAYLKRLPITQIKIDRSFVMAMATNEDDATIVRSTIDLGRNLGLEVVAEGVETEPAWNTLRELGCTLAQGYYLSRPQPPEQLTAWLLRYAETGQVAGVGS